eukprot:9005399-Alexandrium_andersonii.AAC.1
MAVSEPPRSKAKSAARCLQSVSKLYPAQVHGKCSNEGFCRAPGLSGWVASGPRPDKATGGGLSGRRADKAPLSGLRPDRGAPSGLRPDEATGGG